MSDKPHNWFLTCANTGCPDCWREARKHGYVPRANPEKVLLRHSAQQPIQTQPLYRALLEGK